ncbi:hypothetical protein FEC77_07075 [Rickettsia parkeri]|nr:hypothetical protein FEC77_07075 [Rickettsia parkeri]
MRYRLKNRAIWFSVFVIVRNYKVIDEANLRSLLLFHEIATQPMTCNDGLVSTHQRFRNNNIKL